MQQQFPGQEFPGDDPANYLNRVPCTDPFDLARSPGKVLDELGHEFRVGINGFGRLGRAIFCKAYNTPYINIVAVNDPNVDAAQAATLLREAHSQGRLAPGTSLEIQAEAAANTILLNDTATGKTATVQFSAQDDPTVLGWASLGAFHVVECSGMFTTVAAASAHLATGTTFSGQRDEDDGAGGAFKVLIAAASPDAPRFYPRVNLREYRVEQSVFACAPPGDDEHLAAHVNNIDENHVWQYADHVLELLSLVLARDGAAASWAMVQEEGRAPSLHTLFEESLRWVLGNCLSPREFFDYLDGELEMGNSEFMMTLIWTWSALLAFALGIHAAPHATPPTGNSTQPFVHLRNGTLVGVYNQQYRQEYFLGIPYAEPPTGDRRFRRPSPPVAWDGVKPATTYGPACFGNPLGLIGFSLNETSPMSEDCLHVNVVRPAGTTQATRLPVLAWIHGGNWQDGSTREARYNGSFLVQRSVEMNSPIIFISFNYRLGVFGLIAGQAAERANLTNLLQYDQRQALRWVQENIGQFGGDRERVTIMGESSGAGSIGFHLLAYGGRDEGLFHGAIAQSGGPLSVNPFPNITQRDGDFNTLLNITSCSAAIDAIACLRTVPASLLRMASSQVQFYFTVDGDLLPARNSRLLQSGRFLKVPLLIGVNRNEATTMIRSSLPTPLDTDKDFMEFAQGVVGANVMPPGVLENLTVLYQDEIDNPSNGGLGTVLADPGPAYGSAYGKTTLWFGDYLLGAGRRYSAQVWADNNVPSYSYFFDTVPASLGPQTLGVAHGQEIPFAFCNIDGVGWDVDPFPADPALKQEYDKLATTLSSMWISFAATNSPNFHKVDDLTFQWPVYSRETPMNIVFNATSGVILQPDNWRTDALALLDNTKIDLGR